MMTREELGEWLERMNIIVQLPDGGYSLPARDWIDGEFSSALGNLLGQLGFTYSSEKRDCDDFARMAASYAALLHSKMVPVSGLAFGEFWYTRSDLNGGGGHAINCYVVREGGELGLHFFEPQTQQTINLTKDEIESCSFCRI
jgi:hypothetical protein